MFCLLLFLHPGAKPPGLSLYLAGFAAYSCSILAFADFLSGSVSNSIDDLRLGRLESLVASGLSDNNR